MRRAGTSSPAVGFPWGCGCLPSASASSDQRPLLQPVGRGFDVGEGHRVGLMPSRWAPVLGHAKAQELTVCFGIRAGGFETGVKRAVELLGVEQLSQNLVRVLSQIERPRLAVGVGIMEPFRPLETPPGFLPAARLLVMCPFKPAGAQARITDVSRPG